MSQAKEFPQSFKSIIATIVPALVIAIATSGCDPADLGRQKDSPPPATRDPIYRTQDFAIQGKLQSVLIPLAQVNILEDDSEKLMDATYKPTTLQTEDQLASEFVPSVPTLQVHSYAKLGSTSNSWRSCTTTVVLTQAQTAEFSQIFASLFFCEHKLASPVEGLPVCSGLIAPGYRTQFTFLDAENKQIDITVAKEFSPHCHPQLFHSYCHKQQSDLLTRWAQSVVSSHQARERNCDKP